MQISDFRSQKLANLLHIFPDFALRRGVSQQVRRVKRRNQLGAAEVVDAAAQPRNRVERAEQRLRAELAERDDHLRFDDVDLPEQKRLARLDFVGLRIAVARRAALDHVRDVDVLALEIDRFDDLGQQLTGAADEWNPLNIFIGARSLTDEHQIGFGIADAEHDLRAAQRVQFAACAVADVGADGGERFGGVFEDAQFVNSSFDRLRTSGGGQRAFAFTLVLSLSKDGLIRALAPRRIATHARDAQFSREFEVFEKLIAIHGEGPAKAGPYVRLAGCSRPARSFSTRSRISAATRALVCSGSVSAPAAPTIVTALVSTSKPASVRETSLATITSACLRARLSIAFATTLSVSAAKPTSSGPFPDANRRCPRSPRISGVFVRTSVSDSLPFGTFWSLRCAGL